MLRRHGSSWRAVAARPRLAVLGAAAAAADDGTRRRLVVGRRPDPGQAAAAVGRPGPVRRLLRRPRPGLLRGRGPRRHDRRGRRRHRAAGRRCPPATSTTRSPGCPRCSARSSRAPSITDVAQIFERSATTQVSFKDKGITSPADFAGKNDRQLGLRQRVGALRRHAEGRRRRRATSTLVQQAFDMNGFLAGDIDAAQAMTYNEYAQVLETENPDTGELYQPEDLNVINWNDVGTAMLQDAIWAQTDKLGRPGVRRPDRRSSSRPRSRAGSTRATTRRRPPTSSPPPARSSAPATSSG